MIASRVLQGLGAAVLVPNSLALLNHGYPDARERGWAVAIWAAGASVALLLGSVDKSRFGIASGALNSMRQIGSVIGGAVRFNDRRTSAWPACA